MDTLYRKRSTEDEDCDVFLNLLYKHMFAMTGEDLRSKAEIARELAWRDREIMRLEMLVEGRDINGDLIPAEPTTY